MRVHALIPAAGNGSRCGGDAPKQYWMLDGKPVLLHSIERLRAALPLDDIHVAVAPGDHWYDARIGAQPGVTVSRCGGATRGETVHNVLAEVIDAADDDWIVVHDAVRPCVDAASLHRLIEALAGDSVGGLLGLAAVSTLKRNDGKGRVARTESREGLWHAQTPQMFRYRVLRDALASPAAAQCTDEAQAVEMLDLQPRLVPGSPTNIKITYPDDMQLAAAIMAAQRGG
ncbi:MAG: 2-C-methyl-D-erythritol 4-phosphate cytidylyltransferase [Burkholderiales bacterium]